jgi:hypothetical protein
MRWAVVYPIYVFYRSFAIHVVARMTYVVERALEQGSVSSYNGMESMFASSKLLMIDILFSTYCLVFEIVYLF